METYVWKSMLDSLQIRFWTTISEKILQMHARACMCDFCKYECMHLWTDNYRRSCTHMMVTQYLIVL